MTTTTFQSDLGRARGSKLKAAFRFFGDMLDGIAEAREMSSRYQALSRLSNEELARRGLTRETIPQAVVGIVGR
jgi:hypothetical protein